MPRKPKRPCSSPGCPRLTDGRYCEEHAKAEAKRYEKTPLYAVGMGAHGNVSVTAIYSSTLCARNAGRPVSSRQPKRCITSCRSRKAEHTNREI